MKTDRELLELAAKAAGIEYTTKYAEKLWVGGFYSGKEWNPLADDGDALRLAVKLGMDISLEGDLELPSDVTACEMRSVGFAREPLGLDAGSATRRAIVRAAATVGESM